MNVIRPPRDCGVYCKNGTKPAARAELSRRQIDTGRYQAKLFDARFDAAARWRSAAYSVGLNAGKFGGINLVSFILV